MKLKGTVFWLHFVCLSVCLWVESCPFCIFHNTSRIHIIFTLAASWAQNKLQDPVAGLQGSTWHGSTLLVITTVALQTWEVLRVNISWWHLVIAWKVLASVVLRLPPLLSGTRSPSPSSVPSPLTLSRPIWRHICLMSHIHNATWHFYLVILSMATCRCWNWHYILLLLLLSSSLSLSLSLLPTKLRRCVVCWVCWNLYHGQVGFFPDYGVVSLI